MPGQSPKLESEGRPVGHRMTHDALSVPQGAFAKQTGKMAVRFQFIYSVLGMIFSAICVTSGLLVIRHGITANTKTFSLSFHGFSISASDVPFGVVLEVIGLVALYITKFSVKVAGDR